MNKVEIYIGYTDKTWDTAIIEIPKNLVCAYIGDFIEQKVIKIGFSNLAMHGAVAFAGLYNENPIEGLEDEK